MKRPVVIALLVVALLFVLAGIGAVVFFTINGGFPANNPFDRRNISSVLEESKTLKVDAEKPIYEQHVHIRGLFDKLRQRPWSDWNEEAIAEWLRSRPVLKGAQASA